MAIIVDIARAYWSFTTHRVGLNCGSVAQFSRLIAILFTKIVIIRENNKRA